MMMKVLFRCLVAVLPLLVCEGGLADEPRPVLPDNRPELVCEKIEGCNADIAIVVDKSGSIIAPEDGGAPGNWQILKNFIYEIMRSSNFGTAQDTGAKYSVQFFANNANLKLKFKECSDMSCVQNIIEDVNAPAGKTNTNAALQKAINEMFTAANGDRPEAPDVIVLITDGVPNPHNEAALNATVRAVKAKGIRIIGVGIGAGVDHNVMHQIVSDPARDNYFQITSFDAIVAELSSILEAACIVCREVSCWNDWSEWSACSVTCGDGTRTRTRRPRGERQCEGPAEESTACSAGSCECDPKTINFNKAAFAVEADKNFNQDQILGSWYEDRWYLPIGSNVSDYLESYSVYNFVKAGHPKKLFSYRYSRDKLKQCCNDETTWAITQISNGVYGYDIEEYGQFRGTYIYTDEIFMVLVLCFGPNLEDQSCADYGIIFWSRCKKARRLDVAKGEHILRKLCYPHMKRFVCIKQDIDCHDPPMKSNLCGICDEDTRRPKSKKEKKYSESECRRHKNKYRDYDDDDHDEYDFDNGY